MDAPNPRSERTARRPLILAIQSLSVATASSLLLWTAGGGFDGPHPRLASAGTKLEKPAHPSASGIAAEVQERKVKLNYFSSTWDKVFQDVAEATGSQLIADRVPKGRFSRRDATEYTRHDAVRIINKDIEPLGFRLIEKGDFLVVIDLPSQRPRYQPVIVSKEDGEEKVVDPNRASSSPFERRVASITTRDNSPTEPARADSPRRADRKPVRQVSHDDPAADANEPAPRRVTTAEAAAPAKLVDEPLAGGSQVVFRPRHRTVVDLSKQIYRALRPRAQLVSHGPHGLPAFRISSVTAAPQDGAKTTGKAHAGASFTIAIDEASDELLIEGQRAETDAMLKLLRTLDRPFNIEDPIQVTASTKYVCQIAHQLPAEIERIRAANQPGDQPNDPEVDVRAGAEPRKTRSLIPPSLGDAIGSLKGEVTIQSVDDLGVLIIRGNEKDVDQVMAVIRRLEELSEATAPKVHLLYLKNVDAESLAELLTTVYEKLTKFPGKATQPRQSAAILPVTKPNSLLIIAPEADLQSILELAEELDRPVDPLTEFQVFHLKTAIASQVEELITKFYAERKALGAKILVTSDGRSNAVIVRAQARDLDEIAALIKKLDREFSESVNQLKIFPLKSAVAADLAAVMNAAIQSVIAPPTSSTGAGGGGQQGGLQGLNPGQVDEQFKSVKSTVLEWKVGDQLLKSGMLADIRITPDSRANAIIVSASEQSMALIEQLIKQLDMPTSTVSVIKVFTLANADAELMVTQLNTLFNAGQTQGAGNRQNQQLGIALSGADDASSSLVPLKFSVDKRTNSIVATGSADAMKVVEAILLRLDESDLRARQTIVLRLQNSPATQVATEINQFFTSQRDLTQNDPNLISSIEQLERDVVVVADTATNSLIISATPRYFEEIKKMVSKLDEPPRQVIIQALLVEVELSNTDEFGIELGFQDSLLFNRSTLDAPIFQTVTTPATPTQAAISSQKVYSGTGQPGFNFNNPTLPLGNNLNGTGTVPKGIASQGLSNFSLGRINGDLGFGGLVLSAGSENVNALLRALSAHRRIQILSRPQIRALDNQQAEIFSGQKIPTITSFTANAATGVNTPVVTPNDVGVQLICIPRVTSAGQVFMQISALRSQYRNEGVPLSTDAAGKTIESPILDISRANTTISVQTGQTVVIGGLINTRDESFTNKVPFLGDIPLIGAAFRFDSRTTRRTELLVFLTPRVIGGACDEETIKEVEMGRLHYIESEAEDIHGPLRALPAPDQVFDEKGTPWNGPGNLVPGSTGPLLHSAPQLPPPPVPKADDDTTSSPVIHDPSVGPAGVSRLRYTEEDDQPSKVQQAKAEVLSSRPRSQTKPPAKSGFKGWSSRN